MLAFFRMENLDVLVAVGDIVDGAGDVDRCCELLQAANVRVVAGNHERWLIRDEMRMLRDATDRSELSAVTMQWIAALPRTLTMETPAGTLLLCHGAGTNDMEAVYPDEPAYIARQRAPVESILAMGDVDIVLGGHTHQRMVRRIDHVTFVNAGTLAVADAPCCAIIDAVDRCVSFFDVARDGIRPAVRLDFQGYVATI